MSFRAVLGIVLCIAVSSLVLAEIKSKPSAARLLAERIERANRVEVFSLQPTLPGDGQSKKDAAKFHGWEVLGSTILQSKDAKQKEQLAGILTSLSESLRDPDGGKGCIFTPRHGLRVTAGGKKIDLVICLECNDVDAYPGKKRLWLKSPDKALRNGMNSALKDAGIPLAGGAD